MLHLLLLCDESFRFLRYYIDDISILKSLQTEKPSDFGLGTTEPHPSWSEQSLTVDSELLKPPEASKTRYQRNKTVFSETIMQKVSIRMVSYFQHFADWLHLDLAMYQNPGFPGFHLKIAGMSWYVHGHLPPNSTQIRVTWELQLLSQATRLVVHDGDDPGTVLTMGARARCRQRANSPGKAGKAGGAGWKNGILDVSWNKHQMYMDIHWYTNQQRSFSGLVCKWWNIEIV